MKASNEAETDLKEEQQVVSFPVGDNYNENIKDTSNKEDVASVPVLNENNQEREDGQKMKAEMFNIKRQFRTFKP